jgi:hypothetical protein
MRATVLLADSAQADAANNKIHALGIGWSVTSTPTPAAAVVVILKVPWTATNTKHTVHLSLVDSDGQPVRPGGGDPLEVDGEFELGRPAGLPPGTEIDHNFVLNLSPGIPLPSGQMYEWRLSIDGRHEEDWVARFYVRPGGST